MNVAKNKYIKSKSIIYLPKIINMSGIFNWCSSLKSLPDDISKFDTKNVIYRIVRCYSSPLFSKKI